MNEYVEQAAIDDDIVRKGGLSATPLLDEHGDETSTKIMGEVDFKIISKGTLNGVPMLLCEVVRPSKYKDRKFYKLKRGYYARF